MRIRPITTMASLLFAFTLTACGAADNPPATPSDKQGAEASTTSSSPAPVDTAAATEACIEAVRQSLKDIPDGQDVERPAECEPLDDSAYLEAYMKGLQKRNQDGRDELQRQIDEAASAAATP